jgi:hypothetical protein
VLSCLASLPMTALKRPTSSASITPPAHCLLNGKQLTSFFVGASGKTFSDFS